MPPFPKEPHNAIICGSTNTGKTHVMLDIIEKYYKDHFEKILIICPTFYRNQTYLKRDWVKNDSNVVVRQDSGNMMSILDILIRKNTHNLLVVIDDCSSEKDLDKHRTAISKLAFSGRHSRITTWFLSQRFVSVPKDFRENAIWMLCTACTSKSSFNLMIDNYDLFSAAEASQVKEALRKKEKKLLIIDTNWSLFDKI